MADHTEQAAASADTSGVDGAPAEGAAPGRLGRFAFPARAPLYANAYALLANQVLSAALGFLYWLLAARLYPVDVVGRSSAVISTLLLIAGVSQLGMAGGMVRFVPRAGRHARLLILAAYTAVPVASAVLSLAFLLLGRGLHLTEKLTGEWLSPGLIVPATVCWAVFYFQDGILNGLRRSVWVLIENFLYNVAKIALLVIGVKLLGDAGILASWFVPTPFAIALVVWLVFGRFLAVHAAAPAPNGPPLTVREVVGSVTGDHVGSMIAEFSTRALPLLVVALLGAEQNAFFYQAWLVATTLSLAAVGMTSSFTAQAAADSDNIARHSKDILRHMLLLIGPVSLAIVVFAPFVLALFGPQYVVAAPLLRLLGLAAPIVAFNIWYLAYSRVTERIWRVIALQALTAIVVLGISYAGLPRLGIVGVGIAWLAGQVAVAVFALGGAVRLFRGSGSLSAEEAAPSTRSAVVPAPTPFGSASATSAAFVSPHLDDAVLSCGGAIRRLTAAGWDVTVATVCTDDPDDDAPRSGLARRMEAGWSLGPRPFASRREEDDVALQLLGAKPRYLGMLDVVYRSGEDGAPLYPRPVNVRVHPADARSFVDELRPRLAEALAEVDGPVFCPAGVGGHVDHLLVKEAVESLCDPSRIVYYEEYPYLSAARLAAPAAPTGDVSLSVLPLSAEEVDARVTAIAAYRSQVRGLFPTASERLREIVSARIPVVGPRLATPDRRPPGERVATRVRPDVEACGGERYWSVAPLFWPRG